MRLGRNVCRTLLEYYRFTNVLPAPLVPEISSRKSRPKTHRSRSRVRNEVKPRPKTTRVYAPITYKDLSINYDSGSSNEGSPVRYSIPTIGPGGEKSLVMYTLSNSKSKVDFSKNNNHF